MQDREESDLRAEAPRIARDSKKRFRSGPEENAVDPSLL
jgi:hypothetical protein